MQPVSPWSSSARVGFKACSQRWAAVLSDDQRAGWVAFSAVHPFTNVFGDSITLSGVAFYAAVNQRVRLCGGAWIDDPPATFVVGDLGIMTVVATAAAGEYSSLSCRC